LIDDAPVSGWRLIRQCGGTRKARPAIRLTILINDRLRQAGPTHCIDLENLMPIAKIIEISAESTDSFEDAIRQGVEATAKTVRNIQGAWVKEQSVVVEGGKIAKYRADLKITFIVE
jgi:hypothetical protein